jgi:hypothetical protein
VPWHGEVDDTGSGSYPVASFGVSSDERTLVNTIINLRVP